MKDTAHELIGHLKKATQQQEDILFEQRETLFQRTPYAFERHVLQLIREGEPEKLSTILDEYGKTGYIVGNLSSSALRQAQYFAVSCAALGTRAAIDGGMPESEAYCRSDEFIQRIDRMIEADLILLETYEMSIELASLVRDNREENAVSPAIRLCLNYIQEHLHYPISFEDLSTASGLSPSRVSHLFSTQVGLSPMAYVQKCKMKEAVELLRRQRLSESAVAEILGFSSQSHFISRFKKEYGVTPLAFLRDPYVGKRTE
jgi:AraC-like DNA-binding protein